MHSLLRLFVRAIIRFSCVGSEEVACCVSCGSGFRATANQVHIRVGMLRAIIWRIRGCGAGPWLRPIDTGCRKACYLE